MTAGRRDQLASALVSFGIEYAQEASDALAPIVDRMTTDHRDVTQDAP